MKSKTMQFTLERLELGVFISCNSADFKSREAFIEHSRSYIESHSGTSYYIRNIANTEQNRFKPPLVV